MLDQQLACHGLVSTVGATYGRRDAALRKAMKTELDKRHSGGKLVSIMLPNGSEYHIQPRQLDQPMPRPDNQLKILSPFDNAVIQRKRLIDLFSFDYQLECYVPAPKRKYGYLALPLLYKGQFVGRMDCKAHRAEKVLEVKGVFFEEKCATPAVSAALAAALRDFAKFGQLYLNEGSWEGEQIVPRDWVAQSHTPDAPHLMPNSGELSSNEWGYGYQWWVPGDPITDFTAHGIFNQFIYVDPESNVVIAKTSSNHRFRSEREYSKACLLYTSDAADE